MSLCFFFNWAPRCEGVLGKGSYSSTHSLTSALDWGEWPASRPGRFNPRERAPDSHWIGGGVKTQSRSGCGEEKNSQLLFRIENPIIQPVGQRYTTELRRLIYRIGILIFKLSPVFFLSLNMLFSLIVSFFPSYLSLLSLPFLY